MNKKVFRIGNLVDFRGQVETIYQIKNSGVDFFRGKTKNGVITQSYLWDAIQPITITNDWLIKLGFQLYPSGYFCLNLKDKNTYLSIGAILHRKINLIIEQDGNAFSTELGHIAFIHEIQNLYFALTGKELVVFDAVS